MIYIKFPENWFFDNTNYDSDVLIDKSTQEIIPLQEIIKDCLRTRNRHEDSITINSKQTLNQNLTIYFKRPPNSDEFFMKYVPERNGKDKSLLIEMVRGYEAQIKFLRHETGRLWFHLPENIVLLKRERLLEIQERSEEQKHDRRHDGDSPYPT